VSGQVTGRQNTATLRKQTPVSKRPTPRVLPVLPLIPPTPQVPLILRGGAAESAGLPVLPTLSVPPDGMIRTAHYMRKKTEAGWKYPASAF